MGTEWNYPSRCTDSKLNFFDAYRTYLPWILTLSKQKEETKLASVTEQRTLNAYIQYRSLKLKNRTAGTLPVRSWYGHGTLVVQSRCASGSLNGAVPIRCCTLTFYRAVLYVRMYLICG